jgi:tetratricopeptide (TPR) repeat protein
MIRTRRRIAAIALSMLVPAAALAPFTYESEARGDKDKPKPAKPAASANPSDHYDPDNVTAISQYMETLNKGTERYLAKNVNDAIDLYKKAIVLNPKNPLGPYLLGQAYLAQDNMGEAEAAFKTAVESSDSKNFALRARVLFALADCYEREKKWELARATWQTYAETLPKVGDGGGAHPESVAARLKAIDEAMKLDKSYQVVRERIAAEKSAAGDAGKPPAKK